MGHTLVARFEDSTISTLLPKEKEYIYNKVPYGRNCNREKANAVLPYHMTIMHWAKEQDSIFLPRIALIKPQPASIKIEDVRICAAECESQMLFFQVSPCDGYNKLCSHLNSIVGLYAQCFLHITLAVDQDHQLIQAVYDYLRDTVRFPFILDIKALELYHIWSPTNLVNVFPI